MHSSQRAFLPVKRDVALQHLRLQPVRLELLPAIGTGKKTALIRVQLQIDHKRSGQFRLPKNQVSPVAQTKSIQEPFA